MVTIERNKLDSILENIKFKGVKWLATNNGVPSRNIDVVLNSTGNILCYPTIPFDDFSTYKYLQDVFVCDDRDFISMELIGDNVRMYIPISVYFDIIGKLTLYTSHINNNGDYYLKPHDMYNKHHYDSFIEQCCKVSNMYRNKEIMNSITPDNFKYTARIYATSSGNSLITYRAVGINPVDIFSLNDKKDDVKIVNALIKIIQDDVRTHNSTLFFRRYSHKTSNSVDIETIFNPKHELCWRAVYDNICISAKTYNVFGVIYTCCNVSIEEKIK